MDEGVLETILSELKLLEKNYTQLVRIVRHLSEAQVLLGQIVGHYILRDPTVPDEVKDEFRERVGKAKESLLKEKDPSYEKIEKLLRDVGLIE